MALGTAAGPFLHDIGSERHLTCASNFRCHTVRFTDFALCAALQKPRDKRDQRDASNASGFAANLFPSLGHHLFTRVI